MTPQDRAGNVVEKWAQTSLSLPPKEGTSGLRQLIAEEIATALADEVEACATVVEQRLRPDASYHPRGIPGAVRERRPSGQQQRPAWRSRSATEKVT